MGDLADAKSMITSTGKRETQVNNAPEIAFPRRLLCTAETQSFSLFAHHATGTFRLGIGSKQRDVD